VGVVTTARSIPGRKEAILSVTGTVSYPATGLLAVRRNFFKANDGCELMKGAWKIVALVPAPMIPTATAMMTTHALLHGIKEMTATSIVETTVQPDPLRRLKEK
jgi:hypothetical protein